MARLGLKVFYLRTRERGLSQQAVADALGVRQATLSHIEQGQSQPSAALLVELCRYYDVTPTFLLDEERGVMPLLTERWRLRDALVTTGMWVEVAADSADPIDDQTLLCPMLPGSSFYDEEAAALRRRGAREELASRAKARQATEEQLAEELTQELRVHPRRRGKRPT